MWPNAMHVCLSASVCVPVYCESLSFCKWLITLPLMWLLTGGNVVWVYNEAENQDLFWRKQWILGVCMCNRLLSVHRHRRAVRESSNSTAGCIIFVQWLLLSSHPISPVTTSLPGDLSRQRLCINSKAEVILSSSVLWPEQRPRGRHCTGFVSGGDLNTPLLLEPSWTPTTENNTH